jgi:predicted dehydrogenase
MINVGVVGLGMMGLTHLDAYCKYAGARVVAICDIDEDRLAGKTQAVGNIEGQAQDGVAALDVARYKEADRLIADADVDLVDICLPTELHVEFGVKVLRAGKHLFVEKPLGRTHQTVGQLLQAEEESAGMAFVGQCMRFWPGWTWLKTAIDEQPYGKVLAATFRRLASHPGGPFYSDGQRCGGAVLDLHIHDTDFVRFCFGTPKSVMCHGYSKITDQPDHVVTHYQYDDIPLVVAEGGWAMSEGFPFQMAFTVNFEKATAVYDSAAAVPLMLYRPGDEPEPVPCDPRMGYEIEIEYFLNCIATGEKPSVVTLQEAAASLKIVEAEVLSLREQRPVII